MATLLEKAKKLREEENNKHYSPEDVELCLAWVRGEINQTQIMEVKGLKSQSVAYPFIVNCLKKYILDNYKDTK